MKEEGIILSGKGIEKKLSNLKIQCPECKDPKRKTTIFVVRSKNDSSSVNFHDSLPLILRCDACLSLFELGQCTIREMRRNE